jgi:hypothetical protein
MARRKKKSELPFGFGEHQAEIKTAKEALRWARADGPDIDRDEARFLFDKFGDYFIYGCHFAAYKSDSLLGFSNFRSWKSEYEDTENKNWWNIDNHCFLAVRKELDGTTNSEGEALEHLDDYPIFDESDHLDLKNEQQQEDWENYGRSDLRRDIISKAEDSELVEVLMENVTDEMIDEFVSRKREDDNLYPEMENDSTNFPDLLGDWDGEIYSLGEMLELAQHGFVAEVSLSNAAFDSAGNIALRRQDLPVAVQALVDSPKPIKIQGDYSFCHSPYLVCSWTGQKEIEARPGYVDPNQMKLPGVEEAVENHAEEYVDPTFHVVVAPQGTPKWLIGGHAFAQGRDSAVEPQIRVRIPEENEDFADPKGIYLDWNDFTAQLILPNAHYKRMYGFAASYRKYHEAKMLRRSVKWADLLKNDPLATGLGAIDIFHGDSPVWWTDLESGPVQVATLFDLAGVTQPATLFEGRIMQAGLATGRLWLMSLDQWDEAQWPPESQGGPPYTPHVSIAREAVAEASNKTYAIAPVSTPAWLLKSSDKHQLVEIDASTQPEKWNYEHMGSRLIPWEAFIKFLAEPTSAPYWYRDAQRGLGWDGYMAGVALTEIAVLHKGSPVWWIDLDDGPVMVATLYCLVMLGEYPQPMKTQAESNDPNKAWGKEQTLWLMSLDQWDSAQYPPESLGGPPYVKGVSVAREAKQKKKAG